MKPNPLYPLLISFLVVALTSCLQKSEEIIEPINKETTITREDSVFNMIRRVTLLDGSADGVLDNSNCFQLVLPVSIVLDSITVTVNSLKDTTEVLNSLKIQDITPSEISYVFPIEIIFPDYSTEKIDNIDELLLYKDQCISTGDDEDIECVDFEYPLQIFAFDQNNESAFNDFINTDSEFNFFLSQLNNNDIFSIEYPIQLITGSEYHVIYNNTGLQDLINSYINSCNENDQYTFDTADSELIKLLVFSDWPITFFYDKEDLTSHVGNYVLKFNLDGTIISDQQLGNWEIEPESEFLVLDIDFDSDFVLNLIKREWTVFEYSPNEVLLQHRSGGTSSSEYLVLSQDPGTNPLAVVLTEGSWYVSSFIDEGKDETSDFLNFNFSFKNQNFLEITDNSDTVGAHWYPVSDKILVLDIDDSPLNELRNDWVVSGYNTQEVTLTGPEKKDELILMKN